MIATNNYFKEIDKIDFSELPEAFRKGHDFLERVTDQGNNWTSYQSSDSIKKTIDIYLAKLNEFVNNKKTSSKQKKNENQRQPDKKVKKEVTIKQDPIKPDDSSKRKSRKGISKDNDQMPAMVERIPEELRFIKRFVNLDGKSKTKEEILRFVNSLQKSILEKRIRKTSSYSEQIKYIQDKLVEVYNTMKAKITMKLKPETYEELKNLTGQERVLQSINFIKRYIGLNGKTGMKEKAKQLLLQINRSMDKGTITDNDPYISEIHELKKNLKAFTTGKAQKVLEIEKTTLNGLEGILGCTCQNLNGIDGKPAIMNSMDFANMEFATIGLKGKWFDLIGDPSRNFTAMVFGKPKMGKSYLCIDFAGYLARHHGKVLYVAKEEGLDYTLQQKLNDKDVAHPNLDVASILPDSLALYDFIFLDSVNRLGLEPGDLNRLKQSNPAKSFVFIFQSTKDGKFRGANTFQHDVDIVIEVPEKGKAVQIGRFNQGGEMEIFKAA